MTEKEIIKKFQEFRQIKPREEWVFFAKRKILNNSTATIYIYKTIWQKIWQNLFTPIQTHSLIFAARAMSLVMVISVGAFFYFFHLNQNSNQISSPALPQTSLSLQPQNEKLIAALGDVHTSLKKIDSSLSALKNSKNKKQILAMAQITKATANNGEQVIKEIKKQDSTSQQVLASLNELEAGFKEMGEKSSDIQIKTIKTIIDELKQIDLNKEVADKLQEVENYYNEGQYNEAMLLLTKIMD
ncbi:hypothetical protein KKA09_02700 [Patescibacteria group bacterium]|nr:hypothetical protein [Patescibacteria group bacterium]